MNQLHISPTLSLPIEAECVWAAGFFEGEGTVTIGVRKSDETYRLIAIIANTDRPLLELLQGIWGGWLQPAYGERPGRVPAWSWTVAGPRAERFICDIGPHIRSERRLAKLKLAMRFRRAQLPPGLLLRKDRPIYKRRQREFYQDMRELNRRGLVA